MPEQDALGKGGPIRDAPVQDRPLHGVTVQDQAVQDQAVQDQAVQDQAVQDRADIVDLLGRYIQLVDNGDWGRLDTVFTADATLGSEGGDSALGAAPLPVTQLTTLFVGGRALNPHHSADVAIRVTGPDSARVWSKFFIVRADGTAGSGDYLDTVLRTSVGWRIAERLVSRGNRPASDPTGGASVRTFTAERWARPRTSESLRTSKSGDRH